MHCVYVLWSESKKRHYVGYSADLRRRVREHNVGGNRSTKYARPWKLIYYEAYASEALAKNREESLKRNRGNMLITLYKRIGI